MKFFLTILLFLTSTLEAKDYTRDIKAVAFIKKMVDEHHFKNTYLRKLFGDVVVQQTSLSIVAPKPSEKSNEILQNKYPTFLDSLCPVIMKHTALTLTKMARSAYSIPKML